TARKLTLGESIRLEPYLLPCFDQANVVFRNCGFNDDRVCLGDLAKDLAALYETTAFLVDTRRYYHTAARCANIREVDLRLVERDLALCLIESNTLDLRCRSARDCLHSCQLARDDIVSGSRLIQVEPILIAAKSGNDGAGRHHVTFAIIYLPDDPFDFGIHRRSARREYVRAAGRFQVPWKEDQQEQDGCHSEEHRRAPGLRHSEECALLCGNRL